MFVVAEFEMQANVPLGTSGRIFIKTKMAGNEFPAIEIF